MIKVAFVYEFKDENWSTPWSLMKEFGTYDDFAVERFNILKDRELENLENFNPNICIVMDWRGIDIPKELKYILKANGTFLIRECGDTPQNYFRHLKACHNYDYLITPDYESCLMYQNEGYNCSWINHFADTRIQYPMKENIEYYAVTTRGYGSSEILDSITDWGEGTIANKNNLDGIDHTKFLNKGLIVIQNSRHGEITRRIFEGMACGKLVITDRLDKKRRLEELFEVDKEIILYDNINDLAEKIMYYVKNDKEREEIAKAGMNKVLNNYTQKHVVAEIIRIHAEKNTN